MNTLWKGFSAVLLVLLLVVLGGGAWLYTLYNDVVGQKDELVAENGRLIDLAEENREVEDQEQEEDDPNVRSVSDRLKYLDKGDVGSQITDEEIAELRVVLSKINTAGFEADDTFDTALTQRYESSPEDDQEVCRNFEWSEELTQEDIERAVNEIGFNGSAVSERLLEVHSTDENTLVGLCDHAGTLLSMIYSHTDGDVWIAELGPEGFISDGVRMLARDGYYEVFPEFSDDLLLFRNGYADAGYYDFSYYALEVSSGTAVLLERCVVTSETGDLENRSLSCERTYNL